MGRLDRKVALIQKRMIEGGHPLMPRVMPCKQGNPRERIGKDMPHGYRFGQP